MSSAQGEQPVSTRTRIIIGSITAAALVAIFAVVAIGLHNAQTTANAQKAMSAAAPAYQGAISLGGDLDQLNVQSVQAKAAYDAEQARLAAEKAAQEAAQEAAAAAAQAAADEAARQAAANQEDSSEDSPGTSDSGPVKCPAGTHAMAVDDQGNESNCDPLNDQGQQCVAYDDNNQCTAWLQE